MMCTEKLMKGLYLYSISLVISLIPGELPPNFRTHWFEPSNRY